ncbi:class I tRNA ligase family protein, partial [Patescibacteria group bacterium]|nr:class I tRNA ligase family protein [Patescibacteria group bacterium]
EGARDWALSRSRFWGTPLPIWKSSDESELFVASSVDDVLARVQTSGNQYFGLRHGEAVSNTTGVINADLESSNPLTDVGVEQLKRAAQRLPKDIDIIFVSPFERTRQTAEILQTELGLANEQIIVDERLRERNPGSIWEGKMWHDAHAVEESQNIDDFWTHKLADDAESLGEVYIRAMAFMFEIEERYHDKKILIVSHGGVLKSMMFGLAHYGERKHAHSFYTRHDLPRNADLLQFDFRPFPHNHSYVLDLHRPYIDDVQILSKIGEEMKRIEDVFDVWFDSGSMPYAQVHYPFENKSGFSKHRFPAQFIAEGLDQTRGWFYVLSVLGTALFGKIPFENVIVNGLVLAEDGKKMSKRLNNYPDPYYMFNTTGADAVRLYLVSSPVVRGEEFAFSEKGVQEVASKVMGRLRNSVSLYSMYRNDVEHDTIEMSENVLDQWILAKLAEFNKGVREHLDRYELDRAARYIFDFVDDFSTWYVRRSRDRYKGNDSIDKQLALGTTQRVLIDTAKIIAPFVPFVAEEMWQALRDESMPESVHLTDWPRTSKISKDVLETMQRVREIISEGLQLRSESGIKVRQPLASFIAPLSGIGHQYVGLIVDELNVKKVSDGELSLDTNITSDLEREGSMREFLRQVQSLRKKSGLEPHEMVILKIQTSPEGQQLVEQFSEEIKSTASVSDFDFVPNNGDEIVVDELVFTVTLDK